jgi:hypothetical protein
MRNIKEMDKWYSGELDIRPTKERIKNYLIEKVGPKCWECDWINKNPFTGKWVIELDHIDGDHTNTNPKNFRLLCPNCHAMTPTYRSLNTKLSKANRGVFQPLAFDIEEF